MGMDWRYSLEKIMEIILVFENCLQTYFPVFVSQLKLIVYNNLPKTMKKIFFFF